MPSPIVAPRPPSPLPLRAEPAPSVRGNAVLERVAARVRQRLAAEYAAANGNCGGSHAASLALSSPL